MIAKGAPCGSMSTEAADVGDVARREASLRSELLRLAGGAVHLADREVGQPVRRYVTPFRRDGHHAADGLDAPLELGVVATARLEPPAEQLRVEPPRLLGIGRGQLAPAHRPRLVHHARSPVPAALPRADDRARGILDDRHPSGVHHLEGLGQDRAPEPPGAGGRLVGAGHRDVDVPVRQHAPRRFLLLLFVDRAHVQAVELQHRVDDAGPGGPVVGRPAEHRRVEGLGRRPVAGRQLGPAELSGLVTRDLRHDALPTPRGYGLAARAVKSAC